MADKIESRAEEKTKSLLQRLWEKASTPASQNEETTPAGDAQEEAREASPMDDDAMMTRTNYLYFLRESTDAPFGKTVRYSEFIQDGAAASPEQRRWFNTLLSEAGARLTRSRIPLPAEVKQEDAEEAPARRFTPIDASVTLFFTEHKMQAWLFAFPPMNDGAPLTREALDRALAEQSVKYGLCEETLASIAEQPRYLTLCLIAKGDAPVDGEDGFVEDLIPREAEVSLVIDENSNVDYKNLGLHRSIHAGDVICRITPPTEPISGMNVKGETVLGRSGKKPLVPLGVGTELSDDGTELRAKLDGQVRYERDGFRVDAVTAIHGNVNNATGNLDVIGDLVIYGDVMEGFRVHATGTVTVKGIVEGASIVAGGDINISAGMNGNFHGTLDAQGSVKSRYLENCTVNAVGSITTDSIINSSVCSDDKVSVDSGRGVIIGGTIMALQRISAKCIGSKANRMTVLVLGSTPHALKEKARLEAELAVQTRETEELSKNLAYLRQTQNPTPAYLTLLTDLRTKYTKHVEQCAKITKDLEALGAVENDLSLCRIYADMIYPVTHITIGSSVGIVREARAKNMVYYHEGEVVFGMAT